MIPHDHLRPHADLLSPSLVGRIVDEAFDVLSSVGVFIESDGTRRLLLGAGATAAPNGRILIPRALAEHSLTLAPREFTVWDLPGTHSFRIGHEEVHFDPGSAALRIFDHKEQTEREAFTRDLVDFFRLTQRLEHFHFQSTGLISCDVPADVADCYRMFLAFQYCSKPIVTGTFNVAGFRPMLEMLLLLRGGAEGLKSRPLAIFDACPSPPLKWSTLTSQSVMDCAQAGIPSEFVAMPLTGATAPVTLTGALVQHVAENLSGLVIAQCAAPSAPVVFGGSPAAFDHRRGAPPMGAIETMMLDMAASQIGKALGLPTHAYLGLSDSKCVDAQAGFESGIGAVLGALAGINVVSGGGMLDFENCISLEKLIIDHEIVRMAYRLIDGITQRDEPMARELFADVVRGEEFLSHPHTVQWLRTEHWYPRIIDRGGIEEWKESGKPTLPDRAALECQGLLAGFAEPILAQDLLVEFRRIMMRHAAAFGITSLPQLPPTGPTSAPTI
jgi:trimethylamine--corrinoid protein Co-methyltransferase